MQGSALTSKCGAPAELGEHYREGKVHSDGDRRSDEVLCHEALVPLLQEVLARILLITDRITADSSS